ncbi:acyl-CoA dehydrogenase family protein [Paraliomyxa miuraensis]|uniref:acyl-CoA dehydrogenase family protein n=1 Tax=Paraliomyxa miuraensis TaxID=376150 RepID=UPI00225B8CE9|nr:acyl-CoA dehydrogenase family protein [Paraliomyxa miuraensis]MCX4242441.1 acyl-CoA/acyl-ACP dehydrogenase [Paraliomyxa miuraensis]
MTARDSTTTVEPLDDSRERIARWVTDVAGALLERMSETTLARDRDGTPIDRGDLREAARCGLLGASLPVEVGGRGMSTRRWGRVLEHVGGACEDGSFALLVSLFPAVARMIHASGRADLVDRYVRGCITGEALVSFAYTEDSDPFSLASTLESAGDDVIVTASKTMVTGGAIADAYMTYVVDQTNGDLAVVIIDRGVPGVEVVPIDTMGLRGAGLASVHFRGVRIPRSQVMLEHGGLDHVQMFLNPRRAILCCAPVGRMERIIEDCVRRLSRTVRYGQPLTAMQVVQARLGKMKLALNVARTLLDRALLELDEGSAHPLFDEYVSTAKFQITEAAIALSLDAMYLLGSHGYTRAVPVERYLRDFCGLLAGAGAQDVIQTNLGMMAIGGAKKGR